VINFPKQKLKFAAQQIRWVIEYAIFRRGLAQLWGGGATNEIWHEGSLGMRMMPK